MLDANNQVPVTPEQAEDMVDSPTTEEVVETEQQEGSEQAPESATPKKAVGESEIPFHQHPRWKEMLEERNYWREKAMERQQREDEARNRQPIPEPDPYAGMDAETARFYQQLDQRIESKAQKLLREKEEQFSRVIRTQQEELIRIKADNFYKDHSDVKKGSEEDSSIINLVAQGYTPDNAYRIVMFDKYRQSKSQQSQETQQQRAALKQRANVEGSTSIPRSAQSAKKLSFEDEFLREFEATAGK